MEEKEVCKYCIDEGGEFVFIIDTRTEMSFKHGGYPGISAYIHNGRLEVEAAGDTYEPSFEEASVKINYCPICGRKLGVEDE